MKNDVEMVQYFLELGCDPNYTTSDNYSTFYYAIANCNIKMCQLLLNVNNEYPKHKYKFDWDRYINHKNGYISGKDDIDRLRDNKIFFQCCKVASQCKPMKMD